VLTGDQPTEPSANLFLDELSGAEIVYVTERKDRDRILQETSIGQEKRGLEPAAQAQCIILRTTRRDSVTYLAAWLGVVEDAQVGSGETLLVIGANGGVGGAAAQNGKWCGAHVTGVDKHQLRSDSPAARTVDDFFVLEDETLDSC
jgi:hypothetical protein